MSTLIHLIRLKRVESAIQHTIYRVDRLMPPQELFEHTDRFLEKLQNWKDCIPSFIHSQENVNNQIYLGYDSYVCPTVLLSFSFSLLDAPTFAGS